MHEDYDDTLMYASFKLRGKRQTYMSIASDDGLVKGYGWQILKGFMFPYKNLYSCQCKMSLSPAYIWSKGSGEEKTRGVRWNVDCALMCPRREREFDEDWEDPLLDTE